MMNPQDYVLIDFENVQPKNLEPLRTTNHLIKVFLGNHQSKLATEFVSLLLPFGQRVELIRIEGTGHNALDFHIAYTLGRLSCEAPEAIFYVVSKDTGFEPLIRYLRKQGVRCERIISITDMAQAKSAAKLPSIAEQVTKVKANLLKRPAGRPRTAKTLRSSINALFGKKLTTEQQEGLVAELISSGFLSELNGKITYAANAG
jgi:hypothetical protein